MIKHRPALGIGLMICAGLCFAVVSFFYKICIPHLPNTSIIFFQSLCSWLLIAPFAMMKGKDFLVTKHFPMILLRTLLGLGATLLIILALSTVTLAEASVLNNTSPLFVPFIAFLFFKERINHDLWWGLIIGFIGIIIIMRPGFSAVSIGLVYALISGLFSASLIIAVRHIAHENFLRIMFYYFLILWALMLPLIFFRWATPPPIVWVYLLCSGVVMIGAQLLLGGALRNASSQEVAPFLYTVVIFSGLLDWLFWGIKPDLLAVVGMIVVIAGGILTTLFSKKKPKNLKA